MQTVYAAGKMCLMQDQEMQHEVIHQLYLDHRRWLLSWLKRRLHDRVLCEDIVQEAFLQLLMHVNLASVRVPKALLVTVVKNLMVSRYRRQCYEEAFLCTLSCDSQDFAPSAEQQCCLQQTLTRVDDLLQSMPQPMRQAFFYHHIDGLRLVEVARHLGVSPATARRYVRQAGRLCST
ncbi:sigma-70 family RNA polymerase sigma factor [Lampropedia puyangensis]|uniref:Sigma-70 family RNA polymerase sigma factor n=1 Tax=Lampropedia puyangensis TaxID=1330072 RepID=A0A4S8FDR0_9BURK|nr:sigma-70 family RNA polymerase sigma factor [Lampropedia puyangensis]THU05105.1 sigma-70 family RNA polymerase sigma factor [Lampropedia puyangensis]